MGYFQTTTITATGSLTQITGKGASARARLRQVGKGPTVVQFPYGPQDVQYQNLGLEYSQIARPGKVSLLQAGAPKARSVSFSTVVADKKTGGLASVEDMLADLAKIATEDKDCYFTYGTTALPYRVRLTSFSYTDAWRDYQGRIVQAEISIQLDEKVVVDQAVVNLAVITYEPEDCGGCANKPTPTGGDPSPPVIFICDYHLGVCTDGSGPVGSNP